jgi:hypothetical protein
LRWRLAGSEVRRSFSMATDGGKRSCGYQSGDKGEHCGRHLGPTNQASDMSKTMSANYSTMKLGKRPQRHDDRTLKLARYLTGARQARPLQPPASVDYTHDMKDWGMMLNDRLGCCTISAVGHAVQTWTANALGRELTVPDSTILEYYEKWDGYNPADPASDQGGVELDVLNDWRQQGFGGVSLDAYVAIEIGTKTGLGARDPAVGVRDKGEATNNASLATQGSGLGIQDSGLGAESSASLVPCSLSLTPDPIPNPIALAIWLFGGAYIGVELPIRAQHQDVWDVPAHPGPDNEPGSWGGHAVYLVGYEGRDSGLGARDSGRKSADSEFRIPHSGDPQHPAPSTQPPTLTCITWGKPKKMTFAWFEKYCSEAYALVSKDWLRSSGVAPSGFDLATLERDLEEVSGARCQK